jgi:transcriptional regulator with XRE-family HTH domain
MFENIFKWNDQIPIEFMRVEALGKLYAYDHHKKDEMVFKVVPKGGYRGSSNMLKALRVKRQWSQDEAADEFGVSQSAIAKYEEGKRTTLLRVALEIQEWNTATSFEDSWQRKHKREKIFKLNKGIHIASMRIEALGKLYGYDYRKHGEMIFKAGPKREYQGGKLLKELRKRNDWTQAEVGDELGVSQTMVAKYESGARIPSGRAAVMIGQLIRGATLDQMKQLQAWRQKTSEGTLLKEVREKNGWSQKEVGDLLGVSESVVAKYESVERIPSGRAAGEVRLLIRGMTFEQIKRTRAFFNKLNNGELLKELRAQNGWSQHDAARLLDVSQSMVAKHELGKRPGGRVAMRLLEFIQKYVQRDKMVPTPPPQRAD